MFTVEMDHDETLVTILDENNDYDDVQFVIFDDIVYIRQWNEMHDFCEIVSLSPEMFDDFRKALDLSEGSYYSKKS